MITESLIDPGISSRLCLMLLHSLWQVALLACVAWGVERLFRLSVSRSYALHVLALAAGLAVMPITFLLVKGPAPQRETTVSSPSLPDPHNAVAETVSPVGVSGPVDAAAMNIESINPSSPAVDRSPSAPLSELVAPTPLWMTFAPWIVLMYASGVCVMLFRLSLGLWSARRLVGRAQPITDGPLLERFNDLARRCSLSLMPALARASQITVPKAVGLLKPTILLPSAALAGLTPEQLEMILIHELTHLRRHDLWINLLQRITEVVLFFNPALWFLSRRISMLREFCCDEMTCRTMAETAADPHADYACALLRIAELSQHQGTSPRRAVEHSELATLAASGRTPSELRRRVAHLFGEPIREPLRISRGSMVALAAMALLTSCGPLLWPTIAQTTDAPNNQFTFGGKVEVVALGTHDETPQRWWKADGKPLESVPFAWEKDGNVSSNDPLWRRIVFRLADLPDDAEIKWQVVGAHASAAGNVILQDTRSPESYYSRYFGVSDKQRDVSLRVGVATGPWKTVVKLGKSGTFGLGGPNGKSLVSTGALTTEDGTVIVASHNYFDHNFRVIAIDKQGAEYPSISTGGVSAGAIYQTTAVFPKLLVNLDDILHFEFQTREYEWVEVKGLPLEPQGDEDALGQIDQDRKENQNYEFPISITGFAHDEQGQPVAGAEIILVSRDPGYRRIAQTKSDREGTYRFEEVALPIKKPDTVKGEDVGGFEVFGLAEGYALAWRPKKWFYPNSPHEDDTNLNYELPLDVPTEFGRDDPISLDLIFRPPETIRGRIVDDQGQSIPNTKLALRYCDPWWDQKDYSIISHAGNLDSLNSTNIVPPHVKSQITNDDGRFEFTGLPADYRWRIDVRPPGHARRTIWAVTREGVDADAKGKRVYSGDFEVVFPRTRRMRFLVVDEETAEPLEKVGVGSKLSEVGLWETTDEGGLFEVNLPDGEFTIAMFPQFGTPYWRTDADIVVSEETAQQLNVLRLRRAAVVDVTVLDAQSRKPLSGVDIWRERQFPNADKPYRDVHGYRSWEVETRISHYERPRTDEDGKMRVLFEPGTHRIGIGKEAYPPGYVPVEADGKEIDCVAGEVAEVEFQMKPAAIRVNGDAPPGRNEANNDQAPQSVEIPVVIAEHVLLLGGNEVITWNDLEQKIAALPDPSLAQPQFYITRAAREAGLQEAANEQIWRIRQEYKLNGHSIGSLWPRSDLRYDRIRSADDLKPEESLRVDGRVIDATGAPVAGAEIVLVTPIDESISYRSYHIALVEGRVRNRLEHVMTVSDKAGQFTIYPPEEGAYAVIALHPEHGIALQRKGSFDKDQTVRLLAWSGVRTTFAFDLYRESAEISLRTTVREADGLPEVIFNQYWDDRKKPDATKAFDFLQVPSIYRTTVSRSFPGKEGVSFSVTDLSIELLPGETRELILGPLSEQQRQRLEALQNRRK